MKSAQNSLKFQMPESLEPMILMSASAAELNAADLPDGTAGNDIMISLTPDELMDGGAGHDIMIGVGGNNVLRGGEGHDTLISVRGDNVLDGGAGIDKAVYWNGNRADYTVTDHGFGIIEILGDRHSDFITNIEQVQFQDGTYTIAELLSGVMNAPATGDFASEDAADQTVASLKTPTNGDDVLIANTPGEAIDGLAGDDLIVGLGNGNTISGGDGDDALVSAGGNNVINGGAGKDTVIYTNGVKADYTIAAAEGGSTSVTSAAGMDILLNVEQISFQDGMVTLAAAPVVDPVEEVVDPIEEVVDPVEEVVDPIEEEVVDPVEEVVDPIEEEVVDPVEEVVDPIEEEVVDPVEEVVDPIEEEVVDPVEEVVDPIEEEVVDPVEEVVDPIEEEVVDPVEEAPKFNIYMAGSLYATVADAEYQTYELYSGPSTGSLNFYADGTFDYHAVPGFEGAVTFQYTAVKADGTPTTMEAVIHVAGISPGYDDETEIVDEEEVNEYEDVEVDEEEVNEYEEVEVDEEEVNEYEDVEVDEEEVNEYEDVEVDEEEVNEYEDVEVDEEEADEYEEVEVNEEEVNEYEEVEVEVDEEDEDEDEDEDEEHIVCDYNYSYTDKCHSLSGLFDCFTYTTPTYCAPTYKSYTASSCWGFSFNYSKNCGLNLGGWFGKLFKGWC